MKAGMIFQFTTGSYSDFGIFATLRALQDFDVDEALQDWRTSGAARAQYSESGFVESLLTSGVVEEVTIPRLDLASYGNFEVAPEKNAHPPTSEAKTWIRGCLAHTDCRLHPELGAVCNAPRGTT